MKKRVAIIFIILLCLNVLLVFFRQTDNNYLALLLAVVSIADIVIVFASLFFSIRFFLIRR